MYWTNGGVILYVFYYFFFCIFYSVLMDLFWLIQKKKWSWSHVLSLSFLLFCMSIKLEYVENNNLLQENTFTTFFFFFLKLHYTTIVQVYMPGNLKQNWVSKFRSAIIIFLDIIIHKILMVIYTFPFSDLFYNYFSISLTCPYVLCTNEGLTARRIVSTNKRWIQRFVRNCWNRCTHYIKKKKKI